MNYFSYEEYLRHPRFLAAVFQAGIRADGRCEECGIRAKLDPHHIRYCRWGEFDPPENLRMLCRKCHEDAHRCDKCGEISLKAKHIKQHLTTCDKCNSR